MDSTYNLALRGLRVAAVSRGTSHVTCKYTTLVDIFLKGVIKG